MFKNLNIVAAFVPFSEQPLAMRRARFSFVKTLVLLLFIALVVTFGSKRALVALSTRAKPLTRS
jgi:hypothetical protein